MLVNALPLVRQRGYEVHVVLTYEDRRAVEALRDCCDRIYVLPLRRRSPAVSERLEGLSKKSELLKKAYLLPVTAKECWQMAPWLGGLAKLLRRLRPDIVHCNNGPEYNRHAVLLAKAMGIRTVVSVRGPDERTVLGSLAERLCDREVFVSRYLRETMEVRNRDATILYDGLDMRRWPAPRHSPRRRGPLRVGHLGTFIPWKGQEIFLHAAIRVARQVPAVEFYVLGDVVDRRYEQFGHGLRRIAERSACAERIHFVGFQADVRRALLGLDILVHSSTSPEPWGMVILEGMACGLGVIASDEGGPREIIRHGVDGVLVRPRDPDCLANVLKRLVRNADEVRALGQAARKRVAQNFTVQDTVRGLTALYEGLVGSLVS